jgi:hypothetical protein
LCGLVNSQSIYSALQLNAELEYKTKRPKKIVETNIFFNTSGKQIDKNIKTFNDAGMLLTEERYDESGTLKVKLTYTNDTVHRIKLTSVFEIWASFGYSKEATSYTYDSNFFLTGITTKDPNGNILRQTNLVCNEKGHPVVLFLFDGKGNAFGKETGKYLYDRNRVVTSVVSNDGRTLTSDTIKISFKDASKFPSVNEVYNANGDLTKWTSKNLNGSGTIYEKEYIYDSFGNCTENQFFKVVVKGNGKRKREKDRVFKKEYSY